MYRRIYIGFDSREADAFAVTKYSTQRRLLLPIPIRGLIISQLRELGVYNRPHEWRGGRIWDPISEAYCSTEFSNSRFLVPHLAGSGYAMFMDCDMLVRTDLVRLFELCEADRSKAVWCVKHNHNPTADTKMGDQVQSKYNRKNWSSVMVFNCDHPSNQKLKLKDINGLPGRDLHRFFWLEDDEIGELGWEWNYLVGYTKRDGLTTPQIVHFTEGIPSMEGYEDCEYSDEWRKELWSWAG